MNYFYIMKQSLFFILLWPLTLAAQHQDSINQKLELSATLGIHYNIADKYESADTMEYAAGAMEYKELRIADLERQKVLYIFISIVAGLPAIITGIIYRQKVRSKQKEIQLLVANAVFEGEKKERERFAHSLHDGVNSMLLAIRIELASMEHLQNIRDRIDDCIEEIRRLANGVMPVSLQRYGMKAALEDYCRSFPDVCFHFFGENRRIDEKIELMVYYCAYELVHNSVRHSGATAINVQLIQEDDRISLTVQDNGCGYDEESSGQGIGLKSLHDRITVLNGKLEIISSPGNGTEMTIELKI
jgi:signal transduction histidine kinase